MLSEPDAATTERASRAHMGFARRRAGPWVGDLVSLAPLVVVLVAFAGHDGGRGLDPTIVLGITSLLALPAVAPELRRLPTVSFALLVAWLVGLILGVGAAQYRADMTVPLLQYTVAPVLVLCTRRVWRRRWGPGALVVLLTVAFGRYQVDAWMTWWGQTDSGMGLWRPLSWRNQSAALTGMFGVWFMGISLSSTRVLRVGFGILAASAFAGTWLSSSRAGLAATMGAAVLVLAIGTRSSRSRDEALWMPTATAAAVLGTTALLVLSLLSMQPPDTVQAIESRDQGVGQNFLARVEHSEAAFGMFADRPLTGQGLGSYKALARQWNDPTAGLTSSAHNEYAEVAGEMGVLGAVALLGVLLGAALLALRIVRRPPVSDDPAELRGPVIVGATAAASLFLVHSGVDFNWNYPVLTGMGGIALAVMLPERPRSEVHRPLVVHAVTFTMAALLVLGTVFGMVERRNDVAPPWDEQRHVAAGIDALENGRPEEALQAAAAALRWNPGSPAARSLVALAQFERDGDVAALQAALAAQPRWFSGRARAAMALARASHLEPARAVLEDLHADLDTYRAWGVTTHRLLAREAAVVAAAADSCAAAKEVVAKAMQAHDDDSRPLPAVGPDVLAARLTDEGCPDP